MPPLRVRPTAGPSNGEELLQVPPDDELTPSYNHRERQFAPRLAFSLRVMLAPVCLSSQGGGMTTNSAGYESPEARPESIDEQVTRKGIRPVESVEDMAQDGVFESDEELEQFLAHVYAARHAALA